MGDINFENRQYLTFCLGEDRFALEISKVREVLDCLHITKVPRTPEFMLGVINLRGNVVPVVDLRLNLGMEKEERTVNTSIVIVELNLGNETMLVGALTDTVEEVVEFAAENISPPPKIGIRLDTEFIKGMGKRGNDFVIILDMDKVLTVAEIEAVEQATSIVPAEMLEKDAEESLSEANT